MPHDTVSRIHPSVASCFLNSVSLQIREPPLIIGSHPFTVAPNDYRGEMSGLQT